MKPMVGRDGSVPSSTSSSVSPTLRVPVFHKSGGRARQREGQEHRDRDKFDEEAGADTVAAWRRALGSSETATVIYAAGAMAANNIWTGCRNPRTVAELRAYLLFRADPTFTMKQALVMFMSESGCQPPTAEQIKVNVGRPR